MPSRHAPTALDGPPSATLAEELECDLLRLHGPLMGGAELRRALGYPSANAFRQAVARKTVPVKVFSIEHRRGKFALSKDVAAWLASRHGVQARLVAITPN